MFRIIGTFSIKQTYNSVQNLKRVLIDKRHLCIKKVNSGIINNYRAQFTGKAFDVNTKVLKDVLLFKYDNPRFYKLLNIFAISQFLFWNYLSHFAFTTLKDAKINSNEAEQKSLPFWRKINLGENKYRNSITIFCFMIGYGILAASWLFTLRSVRFLILKKGGAQISLVTFTPFGKNRIMDVPLKCVSSQESRSACKVQLPLKIKNKKLYYVLDMRGEFLNTKLFDYTVGLKRNF